MKRFNPAARRQLFPICAELDGDLLFDCTYPDIPGIKDKAIAINYSKIETATITRNVTNPQIVEALTLAGTDIGYVLEGQNNSHQPSSKWAAKTYGGAFDHVFKFAIFNNGPTVKLRAEKLMRGRYSIVSENYQRNANGNNAFEIWGLDVGLVGIDLSYDKANEDYPYEITLGSPAKIKEPHLPAQLFITAYSNSKAIFDALLVP